MRATTTLSILFALIAVAFSVQAEIPAPYRPLPIEPPFSFSERLIDLTAAVTRAKSEGKPLFIYVGAKDCPHCTAYQTFLEEHYADISPLFQSVLIVDIRTWLKGPKMVFQIGDKRLTLEEFKALVGDQNKEFSYPYYWLVSPDLRQIKQLPRGSKYYLDLENHKKLLSLKQ